ncbi:hypothetical protein LQW54_006461 [Pestalotiopsis sp. IQ-011]
MWDSGNVTTTETRLAYSGPALSARSDYTFSVRLSDTTGSWTDWSSGTFGTGLFDETPILRTNFTITKEISKAKLFIAGRANHEAYINGGRVGDHYLAPGFTTYSGRYLYDTHDITSQLVVGDNAIGIAVGQAWFPLYYYGPYDDHGAWDGNMRGSCWLGGSAQPACL